MDGIQYYTQMNFWSLDAKQATQSAAVDIKKYFLTSEIP